MTTKKKRILLIDDEPGFTRLLKLNLEETGAYEVRQENMGADGLATAREFNPDLILLDVIMPDMNGGDIALQIEADKLLKNTPIVFLTGSAPKKSITSSVAVLSSSNRPALSRSFVVLRNI